LEQAILEAHSKFKQKKEKELYAEKVSIHTKIDVEAGYFINLIII
jgi:hypothetical protein